MLAVFVVACGGSEEADPTAAPDEPEVVEPTDEPEVADEPTDEPEVADELETVITIWADETRAPILNDLAAGFEAEYGIGLNIEQVADINDQFPITAAAGEGPDITILAHDRIGGFYESGLLAQIDLEDRLDEFHDSAIEAFTYNGELVGMPYAIENLGFFYNTDLVDTPPTTWQEVMDMGGALVDSGDATFALTLNGDATYDAYPLLTAFGGYIFGTSETGYDPTDVGIDSDGMVAAGEFIQTNVDAGLISDNQDADTNVLLFEEGEIPFLLGGPWWLDRIRASGVPYAVTTFPSADQAGQPFLGVQGFVVNALGDNVLLAQTVLTEFIGTEAVMRQLAEAGNRPSAMKSVVSDDPDLAGFGAAGESAVPMPAIPAMGSVWGGWKDAMTLIINGEQEPTAALTNAAQQIRGLIGGAMEGAVVAVGSWQDEAGCDSDWKPDCTTTQLTDNGDGTFSGTFDLPAGEYEAKIALDGSWDESYGLDGENIPFTVDADGPVTFTFDSDSKLTTIEAGGAMTDDGGEMMDDGMMMGGDCNGVDATGEEIVIYQQAGREGPLAAILGDGFAFATDDVVNYINENGGVCGAEMVVEFCETGYNPENEIACYNETRTADPEPIALLSYGSGATIALKDRVVEDEIVHIVSGLNAEALYDPADGYTIAAFPIYTDQFGGFLQFVADNWSDIKPEGADDDIVVGVVGWANAFGAGANTPETEAFAEELGITLLELEQQEISPEADVSGVLQNLILGGANVIYAQNLSFGTTQVIGTLRALGAWDSVIVGGVNWSFNTDVLAFLGENQAAANGYYGVFPNLWYNDAGNMTVDLATQFSEEGGRDPVAGGVTYLTSISAFIVLEQMLEDAIGRNGFENLTGATLMDSIKETGTYSDGVLNVDVTNDRRAPNMAQIRQFQFNGESNDFTVVKDWFELPDLRPGQ